MKKKLLFSVVTTLFASSAFAEDLALENITVKASGFEQKDSEATYASEIHTAKQIEASGASTLYDYLAQQTSLNIAPNFGSKATPSINLRGFGGENGYQNIVITIDGQRLNNIDMSPQLLAGISVGNIERIEISKGSGSVIYGDGATAGALHIYTKTKTGITASTSWGNYGQKNHYLSAGFSEKYLDFSVNLTHDSHDGFSKKDASGHQDQFTSNSQQAKFKIKPVDGFSISGEANFSRNDIRYVNPLTLAEFKSDPRLSKGTSTHQALDTDQWQLGAQYDITDNLNFSVTHYREDKQSNFITFANLYHYDYEMDEAKLRYQNDRFNAIFGMQVGDSERKASSNQTSKDFNAWFINTNFQPFSKLSDLTLSAGLRQEEVEYRYRPTTGNDLKQDEKMSAWDIGANYRFTEQLSAFANFNKSYQTPDVDRFFNFGGTFNGFIQPMNVRTFTVGTHLTINDHRLKVNVFHANLDNEIYYDPTLGFFGNNTNIDRSEKYGVELQDNWQLSDSLSLSGLYNFTRAVVEKENLASGTLIRGKTLPGTPKQSIVVNLNWKFAPQASLNLNHTWREKAYAYNDFDNNDPQKQQSYESTNLALNYTFARYVLFASVNNIFEHENMVQTAVDSIYPIDFVRTWRVGLKADF
jgi:iron complex outermembrane recepter protein